MNEPTTTAKWWMMCATHAEQYERLGYTVNWMRSGDNDVGDCERCGGLSRSYLVRDLRKKAGNE